MAPSGPDPASTPSADAATQGLDGVTEETWLDVIRKMDEVYSQLVQDEIQLETQNAELQRSYEALSEAHEALKRTQQQLLHSEKMASLGPPGGRRRARAQQPDQFRARQRARAGALRRTAAAVPGGAARRRTGRGIGCAAPQPAHRPPAGRPAEPDAGHAGGRAAHGGHRRRPQALLGARPRGRRRGRTSPTSSSAPSTG
jgi:hypothetical protein